MPSISLNLRFYSCEGYKFDWIEALMLNGLFPIVAKTMTPAQIAEAQRLASDWKPTPH